MPQAENVIGAHLTPDGHGHTPMGCPGVRLEALQKFTVCLRLSRPRIGNMNVRLIRGQGESFFCVTILPFK